MGQALLEEGEVALARGDEVGRLGQLCQPAGGLHVGDLEVVAQMAVGVFVVVAVWQGAQFPAKALVAGVVAPGRAVAVAAPVAHALGNGFELAVVGEHRPAFAHGDVVRGVKAQGGDVAKGAHHLAAVGAAQGIAAVFYQPQLVLFAQGGDYVEVERVA